MGEERVEVRGAEENGGQWYSISEWDCRGRGYYHLRAKLNSMPRWRRDEISIHRDRTEDGNEGRPEQKLLSFSISAEGTLAKGGTATRTFENRGFPVRPINQEVKESFAAQASQFAQDHVRQGEDPKAWADTITDCLTELDGVLPLAFLDRRKILRVQLNPGARNTYGAHDTHDTHVQFSVHAEYSPALHALRFSIESHDVDSATATYTNIPGDDAETYLKQTTPGLARRIARHRSPRQAVPGRCCACQLDHLRALVRVSLGFSAACHPQPPPPSAVHLTLPLGRSMRGISRYHRAMTQPLHRPSMGMRGPTATAALLP